MKRVQLQRQQNENPSFDNILIVTSFIDQIGRFIDKNLDLIANTSPRKDGYHSPVRQERVDDDTESQDNSKSPKKENLMRSHS